MRKYDHFHAEYRMKGSEEINEIEGGFTSYPDNWEELNNEQQWDWRINLAQAWGMPTDTDLLRFWLAG